MTPPKNIQESVAHVLLVDDDSNLLMIVSDRLMNAGYRVSQASSLREALGLLESENFHLVLLDIYLPDQNAFLSSGKLHGLGDFRRKGLSLDAQPHAGALGLPAVLRHAGGPCF